MSRSFQSYKADRDIVEFDNKFTGLCESIVLSGVDFDSYWQSHGLPTLLKSEVCQNDEELLVEFGMGGWFGRDRQQPMQRPGMSQPDPNADQFFQQMTQNDPANQANMARQKKLANFQKKVDQNVSTIKNRFMVAMKDFLKAITDDAKSQGDPHMWQIAQSFYKKILASAQPVVDQFKMTGKFGTGAYKDQFNKERGMMQQNHQANMKQNLTNKFLNLQSPHASSPYWPKSDDLPPPAFQYYNSKGKDWMPHAGAAI